MANYFNKDRQMTTTGSNVSGDALPGAEIVVGLLSGSMDDGQIDAAMDDLNKKEKKNVAAITNGIAEKMLAEPTQRQFLVRGAKLRCTLGSHSRKLNLPECHGVYITGHPAMQKEDCVAGDTANIPTFGVCQSEGHPEKKFFGKKVTLVSEEDPSKNVKGCPCTPTIVGKWMNCHPTVVVSKNDGASVAGEDPFARTYANALTTDSFLVCMYGGIIEPHTSGQEEEIVEGYDFYKMMDESYGFTPEEAALIKSAHDDFMGNPANQALSEKAKAHKFFSNLSALTDDYRDEALRWNLFAGNPSAEEAMKYFEQLGMSSESVQALKDGINRQHQETIGGRDFAHEMMQYAVFSNESSLLHTFSNSLSGDLSALGSVYLTYMGIDDMQSSLNAHNIYNRFSFNTGMNENLFQTMTNYNFGVQDGSINGAYEFLSNFGNGNPNIGLENLKTEFAQASIEMQAVPQGERSVSQDGLLVNELIEKGISPEAIEDIMNSQSISDVLQDNIDVEAAKQEFLDYLEAELKKQ